MSEKEHSEIEVTNNGWFYNTGAGVRVTSKTPDSESPYTTHQTTQRVNKDRGGNTKENVGTSADYKEGIDTRNSISEEWKKSLLCMGFGTFFFAVGTFALVGFTVTFSSWLLYVTAASSMAYLGLRGGVSYYMYKDAKILNHHAENNRVVSPIQGEIWAPKPRFWGVITFIMPPFAEYGPVTAYIVRRHKKVGSP